MGELITCGLPVTRGKQVQEFPALLDVPVDDWLNLCEQRREVVRETMRVLAHS